MIYKAQKALRNARSLPRQTGSDARSFSSAFCPGTGGAEKLFEQVIETAKRGKHLTRSHLNKVHVDTTVQEKAIAFPTDARLYYKMRAALVRAAESRDIVLRQNYRRLAKRALSGRGHYSHAKQHRRARRETKRLKTMLGRVYRDILRKFNTPDEPLVELLKRAEKLLLQEKHDSRKLYSVHAPVVECIAKKKATRSTLSCAPVWLQPEKTAGSFLFAGKNLAAGPTTGRQIALIFRQINYESAFCLQLRVFQYRLFNPRDPCSFSIHTNSGGYLRD